MATHTPEVDGLWLAAELGEVIALVPSPDEQVPTSLGRFAPPLQASAVLFEEVGTKVAQTL